MTKNFKKLLMVFCAGLILSACSFKSGGDAGGGDLGGGVIQTTELQSNPNFDSDGDGVSDDVEINLGRNPLVAELPDLKLQFMKDFKLSYDLDGMTKLIDSTLDIRSKNFEYRVGEISLFDISKKTTAHFARFDGVVVGDYKDTDLTRVSYPYVSPKFIALQNFNQAKGQYNNAKITFTNTLKLGRNKGFQTIVNPTFNFHYFNYETGEYELLGQKKIEKIIYEGVLEKFDITLENLPKKLLEDNFLNKGELITAELDDFEIPSMNTTYKKVMGSILNKCIPITVITPVGTNVFYVAINSSNNHLGEFLKTIYGNNFKILNNELVSIDGLTNNLPKFKLLSELISQTKIGKWFILVNDNINDDVFQHVYKNGDKIVLNYMTGNELANQSYKENIITLLDQSTNLNVHDIEMGEIGQNDELQILLRAKEMVVDFPTSTSWGFNDDGGVSNWIFQIKEKRSEQYSFTDLNIQKRFSLVLNGKEFFLSDLIKEKNISVTFEDTTLKISIPSVAKAFSLDSDDIFKLTLRVFPDNHNEDIGVWLTGIGGWAANQTGCNSADAVCRAWVRGFPVGLVCSHLQSTVTNACTGVLKDEYRKKNIPFQRDLHFDANFLVINKYN